MTDARQIELALIDAVITNGRIKICPSAYVAPVQGAAVLAPVPNCAESTMWRNRRGRRSIWTRRLDTRLRRLRADGKSWSVIAAALGMRARQCEGRWYYLNRNPGLRARHDPRL